MDELKGWVTDRSVEVKNLRLWIRVAFLRCKKEDTNIVEVESECLQREWMMVLVNEKGKLVKKSQMSKMLSFRQVKL